MLTVVTVPYHTRDVIHSTRMAYDFGLGGQPEPMYGNIFLGS
jgi:hypothetical protein